MTEHDEKPNTVVSGQNYSGPKAESARADKAQDHLHEEQRLDNAQRRHIINVVGVFLIASSIFGTAIGAGSKNGETREWAQGIVTVLLGGFAGFITGRAIK